MNISVNYQNSISIYNKIFVDPLNVSDTCKAEYIFFTHPHWDHFSVEDINKILTSKTILVCPKTMENEVQRFPNEKILVEPNKTYRLQNFEFTTFKSYNIDKKFHPKDNNWVGYNLLYENKRIVIVGDSDDTKDLREQNADILLIPIGGTYTMNVEEAANVTNFISPKIVIPTHYGEIVGNKNMGKEFAKLLNENIFCEIKL